MIDPSEFVWRTTIPLTSDSSVLTHFKPNQSYHALATQQNVLAQRFYPVLLTSAGGSLGYLEEGPIWASINRSYAASVTSTGPFEHGVLTHDGGTVIRLYNTDDGLVGSGTKSCSIVANFMVTIPLRGRWTVSGLSGDSIFFL